MNYMVTQASTLDNVLQLLGLFIIFILILAAAYFTSRFVGSSSVTNLKNRNIKVIETFKLAPNRYLQIIEVSGKYLVIGVSKDNIEYLTELDADKVILNANGEITPPSFKDVLSTIRNKKNNKIGKG